MYQPPKGVYLLTTLYNNELHLCPRLQVNRCTPKFGKRQEVFTKCLRSVPGRVSAKYMFVTLRFAFVSGFNLRLGLGYFFGLLVENI